MLIRLYYVCAYTCIYIYMYTYNTCFVARGLQTGPTLGEPGPHTARSWSSAGSARDLLCKAPGELSWMDR